MKCEECQFVGTDEDEYGRTRTVCRRRSPIPVMDGKVSISTAYWPEVCLEYDWCGEFERKKPDEPSSSPG